VARFAYNWALNEWTTQYQAGYKPTEAKLRKQLNAIKKQQFPWMCEVSARCSLHAIKNLGKAFDRFFKKKSNYPKFKKKSMGDSFTLDYNSGCNFEIDGKKIRIQKIGWVRLAETLRFEGRLVQSTISHEADRWYVSICCETTDIQPFQSIDKAIGVDVGVRQYADSKGRFYEVPRVYRSLERKLRRLQQSLSRKKKGSTNREKARIKVARCHLHIKNTRTDWLHKLTTDLIRNNQTIGIEDLNIKGMTKNHHLTKSILDAAFGEFSRQSKYKSLWYGRNLVIADRWFASSKICSTCGAKTKQKLGLHVREWNCENCDTRHHRDTNAAVNLETYAVGSTVSACGEFKTSNAIAYCDPVKSPRKPKHRKKQESHTNLVTIR